ncbi:hypothetical protein, partial [Planktothrix sp.]|uniref:hypothetical protein n=1 Tax=Planktothrix sp. TaxID=3088171 RepID=UPI0038D4913A
FQVPTEDVETNEFGNIVSVKKSLKIIALLKVKKKDYRNRDGADTTDIELEGYLINPLEYPQEIVDGMIADAEIKLNSNNINKGTFVIRKKPENPFLLSAQIKGFTKIEGSFRV